MAHNTPVSSYCTQVLPALAAQVRLAPDPSQTIAENTLRWIWADHEQAFCQLDSVGMVAVRCHCTGCGHVPGRAPEWIGHCSECVCLECVCPARRITGRYDPDAGVVIPCPESVCGCAQCYAPDCDVHGESDEEEGDMGDGGDA